MSIKAIIFDFGRVISAQKPSSLFRRYEKDLGLEEGTINRIMFESKAWQQALVGQKTYGEFWNAIGPQLGLNEPREIEAFRNRYRSDESINCGVMEIIHRLHGPYKLAVLSNSPPNLSGWLREWRILDLFDVVFCSGDEGIVKPSHAAFRLTLQRLGVAPQETVFIDDTPENVAAARAVGLHGILFMDEKVLAKTLAELLGARDQKTLPNR